MEIEAGSFQAFYDSALQHPISLWLAATLGLAVCLTRRGLDGALRRYALALVVLSLADAWLTAAHVYGIGRLQGRAASLLPLGFVLAGDFRYLLLVCATAPGGRFALRWSAAGWAAGLTLIVPLTTQLGLSLLPEPWRSARHMFLIYEVAFVALTLALLRWHPNLRSGSWLRGLSRFVIFYYALWACADAIILWTGSDLGYALRVLPNWLYYGGFVGALAWLAPGGRATASPGPAAGGW